MRTTITEEQKKELVSSYIGGMSVEKLTAKYRIGKLKVKAIIDESGIHRRSYEESKEVNRIPEDRAPKYLHVDGKHYVCTCTMDGYQTNDYENKGGFLTSHIKDVLGVEIPTLWERKKYYNTTGNYWWEQWFTVELVDDKPTIKCPFCDWTSEDVENNSGMFETHLRKVHGISKENFVYEHPEWREYFRTANKTKDLQMETDESKFVVCKVCGKKLSRIDWKHMQSHGLTIEEYQAMYGGSTVSSELHDKLSDIATETNINMTPRYTSKAEESILEYIKSLGFDADKSRKLLSGGEIDVYIPSKEIAIEYDGCHWHTEWFGGKDSSYHINKTIRCEDNGVRLIHIFEDEWETKNSLVKSKLKHILGVASTSKKVYARKCSIRMITSSEADEFLDRNHIQGRKNATVYYGAICDDELIGVMLFNKTDHDDVWELSRFACNINYTCPGVAGKLLKHFIRKYNPKSIKSFADRRWTKHGTGNLYEKLGFKFDGYTKPDYRYYNQHIDRYARVHKFNFRKNILSHKYGFSLDMTETEMAKSLGYDRIWDCGLIRYLWIRENNKE